VSHAERTAERDEQITLGEVQLESLVKRFDDTVAVDGIDLHMPPGEFFTLLGPSGCGKTTTLRMIAGFERPTSGRILLDGSDVAQIPPHRRNVNTVFQSYALFPHLSVADNVGFGLKYKRVTKSERAKQVSEALGLVRLADYGKRKPDQLSGGQQQRVALARALVLRPQVLLLDEPLGALDARLRKDLQVELKALQNELGITFVFVTHDQEEALTMSDRIAVMSRGKVEQAGAPRTMYEEPETLFVADFLGVSNLIAGTVSGREDDGCAVRVGERTLVARTGAVDCSGEVRLMIRPERVRVEPHGTTGPNRLPGMIEHAVFLGSFEEVRVRLVGGEQIKAVAQNDGGVGLAEGTPVSLHLPPEALRVLRVDPDAEVVVSDPEAVAPV
jgi:spermidine/putrescine transport system ATP-binding protein